MVIGSVLIMTGRSLPITLDFLKRAGNHDITYYEDTPEPHFKTQSRGLSSSQRKG